MDPHIFAGCLLRIIWITMILYFTFFMGIFWIYIIPKIEKRAGQKLVYSEKIYNSIYTSKSSAIMDVSMSIVLRYINIKIFGDQEKFKLNKEKPLEMISYDVRQASKSELIFSFLFILDMIIFVSAMITTGIFLGLHGALHWGDLLRK